VGDHGQTSGGIVEEKASGQRFQYGIRISLITFPAKGTWLDKRKRERSLLNVNEKDSSGLGRGTVYQNHPPRNPKERREIKKSGKKSTFKSRRARKRKREGSKGKTPQGGKGMGLASMG